MKKTRIVAVVVSVLGLAVEAVKADFIFGTPVNLGPTVNSSGYEWYPSIRADGLEMYFESDRPGGEGTYDIWVSTRASKEDDWGAPTNLGAPINTPDWQNTPTISADGLELYFNDWGLWVVRRATVSDPWGEAENDSLININTSNVNSTPCISSDGLSLFLASWNPWDLYVSTRPTRDDLWSEPVNLGPTVNGVNSSTSQNYCPAISADGLLLVFSSDRDGGSGGEDLWMTRRSTIDGPWSEPVNLGPTINSDRLEASPEISADGRSLLFSSNRRDGRVGGVDIWQAEVHPVVDFNGDGSVDAVDIHIMADNWGTDEPLCDIGPTPFGDGIVDAQDLIVLAEHLLKITGPGETVIERRVSSSSDDAEEALSPGFTNWNYSSDLEIVHDYIDNGGSQLVGMTFRDIDIAPGEVISNAYIEFVCDEVRYGTADAYFLIWGHLTANSQGFVAPYVISNRPKTEAKVPWEPDPWDGGGQKIQTVNIASIIQELIDQEGWAVGNAVEIIIGADPSKPAFSGVRVAESYDGSPSSAPLLHIEIAVP
jgi:hypothetical protein